MLKLPMSLPPTPLVSDPNLPGVVAISSSGSAIEPLNLTLSEGYGLTTMFSGDSLDVSGEEFDWVTVDRGEADVLMGNSPAVHEVHDALDALRLMLSGDTNADGEDEASMSEDEINGCILSDGLGFLDWTEPPLQLCNSRHLQQLQPYMQDRLFDAFHLLQTDPSIQRMVVSLASDTTVYNAVMNNEVVRELITNGKKARASTEESGSAIVDIIKKMFQRSATKMIEAMEKITKCVTHLFKVPCHKEVAVVVVVTGDEPMMEKLQLTILLAVVVLLIVSVTRAVMALFGHV
ncbi:PREDICTED: uncharacterized protein LOC104818512 [Tarenaya hassleriana]|uniref:uncharacterized protein LOC104818512 n=1 Tax=Tarenaya hassleriana TaxID=28532 RepID=UPI00053C6049|nr:PREDICTED: uncharacterized protein LOC104818512 [Tarenaya hassleriana]